ncbi:modulator of FtsH protease HflC [bacterium BMS3Bbin12]|nr:modulator of FtsH protease HflC [bacterium BMS3Abin12]GBE47863.1 modulator of FtsH protease HflC [bacterium BMS3Bbin12]GBE50161.1 modulator of FtsH protease HflC [bacterium BMS3Bbin13]HDJ85557.1 protease modulator HflC [Chromatiales bacterium]HDK03499.1 protease modulator HflC [Gammaproteobacteria bacterium]
MGQQGKAIGLILALVLVVLGLNSVYTVGQWQRAILLRLGEIMRTDVGPGLHFKIPFYNRVQKFDTRILTLDVRPERLFTSEKKNVIVDAFVMWRITKPATFYKAASGDEQQAAARLDQIIKNGLRDEFGVRTIQEVISGERSQVMDTMTRLANKKVASLGISIVDVRIKQINLPAAVSQSVFQRMKAERERVAREFRARGKETAERIRAGADRQRTIILADAERDAAKIRGAGDASATEIYAKAYSKDKSFYSFDRSLQAYRRIFSSKDSTLVLQPNSELFRYFQGTAGARR